MDRRRNGLVIMARLIGLVAPLLHVMLCAIVLGVAGYCCAIFLTIIAAGGITAAISGYDVSALHLGLLLVVLAVFRGLLHYAEQYCNHFIAFKLLAVIRHKVFAALRRLCPAKLEGRDKGNLIAVITTDIELLEVFYAHTISPIVIAVITSVIMIGFIAKFNLLAAFLAAAGYLTVGAILPLWNGHRSASQGMAFRNRFGELNSFMLDSLRGLIETIQYGGGTTRAAIMDIRSRELNADQKILNHMESSQRAVTDLVILGFSAAMLFLMLSLLTLGQTNLTSAIICTVSMMGSFGPVTALASLSNNLNQTLASGERVLSLLEEAPEVADILNGQKPSFEGAACTHVTFAYDNEVILQDYSALFKKGRITGIHGVSGSGKSTILKLLMRFWDVDDGQVTIANTDIRKINTQRLRCLESYVTQETCLFRDSIAENISVAKPGASREDIVAAARKAALHEFIMTLPQGYDTPVGELGETLSGGERQRIGIARAFLHDAPFMLLDEPTSNLDALNEGIILKALKEEKQEKTIVLVSHRMSTMKIADQVIEMASNNHSNRHS